MNAARMGGFLPGLDAHPIPGTDYVGENETWPEPNEDPIKALAHDLTRATRNRSVETFFEEEDRAVRTEEVLRNLVEQGRITISPNLRGVG